MTNFRRSSQTRDRSSARRSFHTDRLINREGARKGEGDKAKQIAFTYSNAMRLRQASQSLNDTVFLARNAARRGYLRFDGRGRIRVSVAAVGQ